MALGRSLSVLTALSILMTAPLSVASDLCARSFDAPAVASSSRNSGNNSNRNSNGNGKPLTAALARQDAKLRQFRFAEFITAIEKVKQRDPIFARLWNTFENKRYSFAIDRSANVRSKVLAEGFLNIHQTGSSSGVNNPEQRTQIEALYTGMNQSAYDQLPADMKPKSMYLIPERSAGIDWKPTVYIYDVMTEQHPGDTWILDLKAIENNTLFTIGDSYNRAMIEGDLLDDPKRFTLRKNARFEVESPINYLWPLDVLKTSIPYFYDQVRTQNTLRFVDEKSPEYLKRFSDLKEELGYLPDWQANMLDDLKPAFEEGDFFERFPELRPFEEFFVAPRGNYVEGLYFGKLPVQGHVKALIFRSRPPSPEERALLEAAGIEVIDGRPSKERP